MGKQTSQLQKIRNVSLGFKYLLRGIVYMAAAYVLINCEYGSEEEIMKELKELPELTEIYQAYGSYDLIAKISADTIDKLKEAITWHIRRTDKIKSTLTLIAIEGQS